MATKGLRFRIDPSILRWDAADDFVRMDCSLCGGVIDEEAEPVPIRLWNSRGDSAVVCDDCTAKVFATEEG